MKCTNSHEHAYFEKNKDHDYNDIEDNKNINVITSIMLPSDLTTTTADVCFKYKIYPTEIKLMRGNVGADENLLFVDRDLLKSAIYKNNHTTVRVLLFREKMEHDKIYSLKISDGNMTFYTSPFLLEPGSGRIVMTHECKAEKKSESNLHMIAVILVGLVLFLCLVVMLFLCCRP